MPFVNARGQRSDCGLDTREAEGAQTMVGSSRGLQGNISNSIISGTGGPHCWVPDGLEEPGGSGRPGKPRGSRRPWGPVWFHWFLWTQRPREILQDLQVELKILDELHVVVNQSTKHRLRPYPTPLLHPSPPLRHCCLDGRLGASSRDPTGRRQSVSSFHHQRYDVTAAPGRRLKGEIRGRGGGDKRRDGRAERRR